MNHKKQRLSVEAFQARIGYLTHEWSAFLGVKEQRVSAVTLKWVAPPPKIIKLNVDAAFQSASGDGGWGVVARDCTGDVILAASGRLCHQSSALQWKQRPSSRRSSSQNLLVWVEYTSKQTV